MEFVFVEVNGKAALVPHLIAAGLGNSEYRKFSFPFIPNFDVTTYFYPDGTFDYGLTLYYVCDENAKFQKMRKGITAVNNNSTFLTNKELQELFIDCTQKISDTIVINKIRKRKFSNINSENEWCKYLKVASIDTIFVVSELSNSELLPKTLESFKTIKIKEGGNYLDTLILNRNDMMVFCRDYR